MKARLLTSDGGFVAAVVLPPFQVAPDVIVWGSRMFKAQGGAFPTDEGPGYTECFAWYAPPETTL